MHRREFLAAVVGGPLVAAGVLTVAHVAAAAAARDAGSAARRAARADSAAIAASRYPRDMHVEGQPYTPARPAARA